MFDCHYDLLTYIYMNREKVSEVREYCNKIFNNNITGGIFNLFYMSEQEMYDELGIEAKDINIIENLKDVKELIKRENLIPNNIKYIFGIEGLDYLKKISDMEELYKLGVRSVNPVWNNHNKFGTGVRPIKIINKQKGLTKLGKKLIKKLIKLGIAIDVSHADEETFWDIIEECEKLTKEHEQIGGENSGKTTYIHNKKIKPKIFASHSNCKAICDVPRNLTDKQIRTIANFGGIIGIVSVKDFCSQDSHTNFEEQYIKHILHIKDILKNVDNIALATDDMTYYKIEPEYYQNMNIFNQANVSECITKLLQENEFSDKEIKQIMYENYMRFFTD